VTRALHSQCSTATRAERRFAMPRPTRRCGKRCRSMRALGACVAATSSRRGRAVVRPIDSGNSHARPTPDYSVRRRPKHVRRVRGAAQDQCSLRRRGDSHQRGAKTGDYGRARVEIATGESVPRGRRRCSNGRVRERRGRALQNRRATTREAGCLRGTISHVEEAVLPRGQLLTSRQLPAGKNRRLSVRTQIGENSVTRKRPVAGGEKPIVACFPQATRSSLRRSHGPRQGLRLQTPRVIWQKDCGSELGLRAETVGIKHDDLATRSGTGSVRVETCDVVRCVRRHEQGKGALSYRGVAELS